MKLFTDTIIEKLKANGIEQAKRNGALDFYPVVKIFNPYGTGVWLLTEIDPEDEDIAFGLCDLGFPELGSVRISELESIRFAGVAGLERDLHFTPNRPISRYAQDARIEDRIVD